MADLPLSASEKRAENEGEDSSTSVADGDDNEEEDAPSVVEEVKEVVESAIDHLLHRDHKEHTSTELTNDAAISIQSRDVSSTETKENKPSLLDKFKEEVEVAGQSADHLVDKFKVGLGKAKEGVVETIADIISDNKKPIVEEVKAPILAKTVQEEVVAPIVNTIKDDTKKAETGHEEMSRELKGESKKEDGCVSSLAQGLEKLCTPWNSKKEV
ncbi:hypothetical protein KSS87_016040 [Heliosperma pusillum]|nr:hypothetical protein KSS87_016040 [Heliosperma pusillum]